MSRSLLKVPKSAKITIPKNEFKEKKEQGWVLHREIDSKTWEIKKIFKKHEILEIEVRSIFKVLEFENYIGPLDFWYKGLGYQIDVCGGVDNYFIVIDCTSKKELGKKDLTDKIKDNVAKKPRIIKNVNEKYPRKYKKIIFAICTEDIDLTEKSLQLAEENGIHLIDSAYFKKIKKYINPLGSSLKYQILRRIAGVNLEIDDGYYESPALRIKSGRKVLYDSTIDPDTLLKLGYVYRMEEKNEKGYQRDIKKKKIEQINEFLADKDNYFANNIILSFDHSSLKFNEDSHISSRLPKNISFGTLKIPKQYCSAEIIDGQHRLYGYLDVSEEKIYEACLKDRRMNDRLSIVALEDPSSESRAMLYLDVNSNQTKINPREIWSLMGAVRPTTLMGYISNIIISLSEKQIFKNKILIPGVKRGSPLNIANFGKGIMDRKLLHKGDKKDRLMWNLYDSDRTATEYPSHSTPKPIDTLENFFEVVKEIAPEYWDSGGKEFLCTNNGVNIMLRILVEVLKHFDKYRKKLSKDALRTLLKVGVKRFLEENKDAVNSLRQKTSNEGGREWAATEIIYHIHNANKDFGYDYLWMHKRI